MKKESARFRHSSIVHNYQEENVGEGLKSKAGHPKGGVQEKTPSGNPC